LTLDDGIDTVSRNVDNELPTDAMQCRRGAKIFTYQWMEIRGSWDSCGRAALDAVERLLFNPQSAA